MVIGLELRRTLIVEGIHILSETLEALGQDLGSVGRGLAMPSTDDPTEPRDLAGCLLLRSALDGAAARVRVAREQADQPKRERVGHFLDTAQAHLRLASQDFDEVARYLSDHPAVRTRLAAMPGFSGGTVNTVREQIGQLVGQISDYLRLQRESGAVGQVLARHAVIGERRRREPVQGQDVSARGREAQQ